MEGSKLAGVFWVMSLAICRCTEKQHGNEGGWGEHQNACTFCQHYRQAGSCTGSPTTLKVDLAPPPLLLLLPMGSLLLLLLPLAQAGLGRQGVVHDDCSPGRVCTQLPALLPF
jgi:hypothetical protein